MEHKVSDKSLANLKPIRDSERARELGHKGGLAKNAKDRKRRQLREDLSDLMSLPLRKEPEADIDALEDLMRKPGKKMPNVQVQTAMLVSVLQESLKGNVRASSLISEILGEKTQRIEMSRTVDESAEEIEAYFAAKEAGDQDDGDQKRST